MSDYTPSTGEVRRRYAYARSDKPGHKNQSAIAEFDRWLAAHDAEVLASAGVTQSEPESRATIQQRVHLFKAGAWEFVPNQEGEQP